MRKAALAVPVLAAAALAAVPASSAMAGAATTTLHLVGTNTSNVSTRHGFSFTEVLRDSSGAKVGNDLGSCVFAGMRSAHCQVGVALDGGVLVGTFVLHPKPGPIHGKIVSGSGAYAGATGSFTAVSKGKKTKITLTFHV